MRKSKCQVKCQKMSKYYVSMIMAIYKFILYTIVIFHYYLFLNDSSLWIDHCEKDLEFCPQCFEVNNFWNNLTMIPNDIGMNINRIFGRKIQRAIWKDIDGKRNVVLKYKLNNENYFKTVQWSIVHSIEDAEINNESFSLCPTYSHQFMQTFNKFQKNLTFLVYLLHNPEIIILKAIQNSNNLFLKSAVPEIVSYCGFVIVEEDRGQNTLIEFFNRPLNERLRLALELLKTAVVFSYGIDGFR